VPKESLRLGNPKIVAMFPRQLLFLGGTGVLLFLFGFLFALLPVLTRDGTRDRRSHHILCFGSSDHSVSYVNGTVLAGRLPFRDYGLWRLSGRV
jgi:hypothetical protein